jgi:acetoin utilization protein AcuB
MSLQLNIPIESIMTKTITTVKPDQKLIDVKHIYEKKAFHHHIPVEDKGKLVGIISLIDFLQAIKTSNLDDKDPVYHTILVKHIMQNDPVSIPLSSTIKLACDIFSKGEIHALPVCDGKELKGIVSTADVIHYFLKEK